MTSLAKASTSRVTAPKEAMSSGSDVSGSGTSKTDTLKTGTLKTGTLKTGTSKMDIAKMEKELLDLRGLNLDEEMSFLEDFFWGTLLDLDRDVLKTSFYQEKKLHRESCISLRDGKTQAKELKEKDLILKALKEANFCKCMEFSVKEKIDLAAIGGEKRYAFIVMQELEEAVLDLKKLHSGSLDGTALDSKTFNENALSENTFHAKNKETADNSFHDAAFDGSFTPLRNDISKESWEKASALEEVLQRIRSHNCAHQGCGWFRIKKIHAGPTENAEPTEELENKCFFQSSFWQEKTKLATRLLEERITILLKNPEAVLAVMDIKEKGLQGELFYLLPRTSTSRVGRRKEDDFCVYGAKKLWGSKKLWEEGQVFLVPFFAKEKAARWLNLVEVGMFQKEKHAELLSVANQLLKDEAQVNKEHCFHPAQAFLVAGNLLGLDFEIKEHQEDFLQEELPHWVR